MKPEPLKKGYAHINPNSLSPFENRLFEEDRIKSAVEYAIQEINNPKNLKPVETIIKEAFEDAISGDKH